MNWHRLRLDAPSRSGVRPEYQWFADSDTESGSSALSGSPISSSMAGLLATTVRLWPHMLGFRNHAGTQLSSTMRPPTPYSMSNQDGVRM